MNYFVLLVWAAWSLTSWRIEISAASAADDNVNALPKVAEAIIAGEPGGKRSDRLAETRRVFFGCTKWTDRICSTNLSTSLLSPYSRSDSWSVFASNVISLVRFYNYNHVRLQVLGVSVRFVLVFLCFILSCSFFLKFLKKKYNFRCWEPNEFPSLTLT